MLALARRAGKLISGDSCESAIRDGKAILVFISSDASENTKKKFRDKTTHYNVPLHCLFNKDELEAHTGLHNRSALAVTDTNFAKKISDIINNSSKCLI